MSAEYDIVWLCTGSITNDRLELERHCRLASALRDNGFTGGIYLSQVISKVMRKDDDVCRHHLSALKEAGVTRFNTGVEIADTDLRKRMIAGHKGDLVFDDYLRVFRMATEIFGSGNAGTCLLAGIEPAEVTLSGLRELVEIGVAPAPTVFTPFTVDQMRIPFVLTLAELAELSAAFRQLQIDHGLPLFSGVFSLT